MEFSIRKLEKRLVENAQTLRDRDDYITRLEDEIWEYRKLIPKVQEDTESKRSRCDEAVETWWKIETIRRAQEDERRCKALINHTWEEFLALEEEFRERIQNTTYLGKKKKRSLYDNHSKYPTPWLLFVALYWAKCRPEPVALCSSMFISNERDIPHILKKMFGAMREQGIIETFTLSG